jgi:hypothetical protein
VPGLTGAYLFSDYCNGTLRAIRADAHGKVTEERKFDGVGGDEVVSFGQDNGGDVYVVSLQGPVSRIDR